jgi:hypothetical protein
MEWWSDGVVEYWRIWILDWGIRTEKDEERRRVKTQITNHKTQITNKSQ